MRTHMPVFASAAVVAAAVAVPAVAGAHPIHNRAITIHATPNHVVAGSPVLIYGRLAGPDNANQEITLYHRIYPAKHFTVIGHARTNSAGVYEFTRAEGVVDTDRAWFVRGPADTHSHTVREVVNIELSLNASATTGTTRHALSFTGTVTPAHAGEQVELQAQPVGSTSWHRVAVGRVDHAGAFTIRNAFRVAGAYNVRVAVLGDASNAGADSDPVSVIINERQAPYATIGSSAQIVPAGTPATISGTFLEPNTSVPLTGVEVGLYAKVPGSGTQSLVQTATTDTTTGGYSFSVQSLTNQLYQVRTIGTATPQATAQLFQGAQDAVTLTSSAPASTVGASAMFSGTVSPAVSGQNVDLERLGRNGHWQVVQSTTESATGTFSFTQTFGVQGTDQFRARVLGADHNIGAASAAVTETVSLPAVSALPGN